VANFSALSVVKKGVIMFEGSIVALVTPFKDGRVDEKSFLNLLDFHLNNKTSGILISGTTGESATLSDEEKLRLFKLTVDYVKGRIPVIAGTGSNNTKKSVELTLEAEKLKVDAILAITPYYNKPTQNGLFEHFKIIAKRTSLPIIIYNVPGRTGISILPETVAKLSKFRNIVAIKEATGSMRQATEINKLCDITLLSGDDFTLLPFLACGGNGVISVTANIIPEKMQEICDLFKTNNISKAREIHNNLFDLHSAMFIETNPIPVKTALYLMKKIEKLEFRLPLVEMSEHNLEKLKIVLKKYNLI
jgi:4-hydroxy-tetrahydrodipicolinate synthase